MATSPVRGKVKENWTCSVCSKQLRQPKVLPCLHSFCRECIAQLAKSTKSKSIKCPDCPKTVQVRNLPNMPSNFFVNNLLAAMALADEKKAKKIVCGNCDKKSVAQNRCEECSVFLCGYCSQFHLSSKATKQHALTSMQDLKSMAAPSTVAEKLRCDKHQDEFIKLFCLTCQLAICSDCTVVDHRAHDCSFISEVVVEQKQKLKATVNGVKQRKGRIEQALANLKKFDEILEAKKALVVEEIDNHFDELARILQEKKRELVEKAAAITASRQERIQDQRQQLETALASCQTGIEFTHQALKTGSDVQLLSMQKYVVDRLEDLKKRKDRTRPCVDEDLTFGFPCSFEEIDDKLLSFYVVDDFIVSPENCIASFNDRNGDLKIGRRSSITIVCYDKFDNRVQRGRQRICPTFSGVEVGNVAVSDNRDGTYLISFCPRRDGVLNFAATINGHPASRCCLRKKVRWYMSQSYGNGEFVNGGLMMIGQGSTYCWRVGECCFNFGVHNWKVQVKSSSATHGYYHNDSKLNQVEVGVIDATEVNTNANNHNKKWVYNVSCQQGDAIRFSLTLEMGRRLLRVISEPVSDNYGRPILRGRDQQQYQISAAQVRPFFSCPPSYEISLVD